MKEVEEIERRTKRKIEPKIRVSVIALRRWGINTIFSCQGHRDRFPFPYIIISTKDVDKAIKLCGWYNLRDKRTRGDIDWVILPMRFPSGDVSIRLVPRGKGTLEELQESAIEFGEALQNLQKLPELPIFLKGADLKTALFLLWNLGYPS